jgi:hypothetical protein
LIYKLYFMVYDKAVDAEMAPAVLQHPEATANGGMTPMTERRIPDAGKTRESVRARLAEMREEQPLREYVAGLEDRYRNEDLDAEERLLLRERILVLKRTLR